MDLGALDAWRELPAAQQPQWPDHTAVAAVTSEMARIPPLVFAGECDSLKERLAAVARGDAFVLQGGDPNDNGSGGPGYEVVGRVPEGYSYKLGDVAMAKTSDAVGGTAGSQFFLISGAQGEQLPGEYGLRCEDDMVIAASGPAELLTPGFQVSLEKPLG